MRAVIRIDVLPMTLNEMLKLAKDNPHKYAKYKRDFTNDCSMYALGCPKFTGKAWIEFEWHVGNLRRDPDNTAAAAKCVMDGIVNAGIIPDDSLAYIQSPILHRFVWQKPEGVILTISDKPLYSRIEKTEDSNVWTN